MKSSASELGLSAHGISANIPRSKNTGQKQVFKSFSQKEISKTYFSYFLAIFNKMVSIPLVLYRMFLANELDLFSAISREGGGGGGGHSSEFLVGVCRPVLQILTQFQTKMCHFPHPFSDLASKIHTRFHTFIVP